MTLSDPQLCRKCGKKTQSERDYARIGRVIDAYDQAHGIRASYQAGCRCVRCRAANAAYLAMYRARQRAGAVLLGATIDAEQARRLLEQLRREQIPQGVIAHALGLRSPAVRVHDRITVRKYMKIKRLHRQYLSEAHE